jgi:hypothetical protein
VQNSGLAPQQQEAFLGSALASSQLAANDAISKVENINTEMQWKADQFNLGQRTKEDLTNQQYNQDFQNKSLGNINAYERDWRRYYTEGNLQNRQNWKDVENLNYLNAMNEQYAAVPGQGVVFLNNQSVDNPISHLTDKQLKDMSAAEYINTIRSETDRKNAKLMQQYRNVMS